MGTCVRNLTKGSVLVTDLRIADSFWSRLKGLLGTASLPSGQGLLITPCNSIHMFGMQYAIDVVFLDTNFRVLKVLHTFPPGQAAACTGSAHVLELPAGVLIQTHTAVGDQLTVGQ
jgi:uncharacterized membrane protein (UPF0127 family)